jgi:hypothetical protein
MEQEALLIKIRFSDDEFGTPEERELVYEIEDRLLNLLDPRANGECDGHEFGEGWGVVFCYGASAESLFEAAAPVFLGYDLPLGSHIIKRNGPPGASETFVALGASESATET